MASNCPWSATTCLKVSFRRTANRLRESPDRSPHRRAYDMVRFSFQQSTWLGAGLWVVLLVSWLVAPSTARGSCGSYVIISRAFGGRCSQPAIVALWRDT